MNPTTNTLKNTSSKWWTFWFTTSKDEKFIWRNNYGLLFKFDSTMFTLKNLYFLTRKYSNLQEKTFNGEINATSITDSKYLKLNISIIYQVTSDGCGSNFELQCLIGKATNISKELQLCSSKVLFVHFVFMLGGFLSLRFCF